ncbi:MAG: hypothetical protein ACE5HZ_00555 [Fidelibacterota bacterium]
MTNIDLGLYPRPTTERGKETPAPGYARKALINEWIGGVTGAILALFIWGHLVFESTILIGRGAYDAVANFLEHTIYIAQPTVLFITLVFFIHFVWSSRKIPAKLRERKRMMKLGLSIKQAKGRWDQDPRSEIRLRYHFETSLWIWQVRTGFIVLATGAFHLFLVTWNIFTDMGVAGQEAGLSAAIATSRVGSGLWILYGVLMLSVVAHTAIGTYRLLVKWFADTWFVRKYARILFYFLFWFFVVLGTATVIGLAGPLEGVLS